MRGRFQGGSLAGFIVVGVLLALVVVGGLYGLNRYNAQRSAEEVAAEQKNEQSSNDEKKTEQPKPAESPKPDTSGTSTNGSSSATTPDSANLPATGPAETIGTMFVLSVVTFAFVTYLRSRRILS